MASPGDFESRMRNMILTNGMPSQAQGSALDSSSEVPTGNANAPVVTSPTPGRRLTQAQRRQGMSNRLELHQSPARVEQPGNGRTPFSPNQYGHPGVAQTRSFAGQAHQTGTTTGSLQAFSSAQSWRSDARDSLHMQGHHGQHFESPHQRMQQPAPAQTSGQFPNHYRQQYPQARNYNPAHVVRGGMTRSNDPHGRSFASGRTLYDPQHQNSLNTDMRPPFRQAEYLDMLASDQIPIAGMSDYVLAANEQVRRNLEQICRNVLQANTETNDIDLTSLALECFGSIASGFATAESDMDIMLVYDSSPEQADKHKNIPRLLEMAFLDAGFGARLLTNTRVPIIRFCERPPPDLLDKLRKARDQWDQEVAKRLAEGKSAEDHSDEHEENDADADEDADNGTPEAAAQKDLDGAKGAETADKPSPEPGKKKRHRSKRKQEEELRPVPYKNDEERIRLYNLAFKEGWFEPEERKIISHYIDAFKRLDGAADDAVLRDARKALDTLPDVLTRYREPRERKQELEYPKEGVGVLCDINFSTGTHSNPLAIHNTRLLRCYSLFDDRIRQMVIFVKAWAKIRKINKPYTGTLSSYGYVLMVLHFAVNIADPPLAPNLQHVHIRNAQTGYPAPTTCNGYDIRFWQDQEAIRLAAQHEYGQNRQSVGSLLAQFFRYYAANAYKGVPGFQWTRDVLSLRTPGGLVSKSSKGWTGATEQAKDGEDGQKDAVKITHRYLLAIEDPFEQTHNVGRPVMHHGIVAVRDEFRRANQLIVSQGYFNNSQEDFFAEGIEKEREHKYFGPNPKHKKPPINGPKNLVGEARQKALNKAQKPAGKEIQKVTKSSNTPATQGKPEQGAAAATAGANETTGSTSDTKAHAQRMPVARKGQTNSIDNTKVQKTGASRVNGEQTQESRSTSQEGKQQDRPKRRHNKQRHKKADETKSSSAEGPSATTN